MSFSIRHRWMGLAVLGSMLVFPSLAAEVEATGRAAADDVNARSIALADALREAVREGAGVQLVSESQMTDFTMDYDRAFSKAAGHLKKYRVLKTGVGEDGFYFVTIKADVAEGAPEMSDQLTLQMLAREKGSPRVSIRVQENISGVSDGGLAADWLRNTATECGLRVIETDRAQGDGGLAAKRAAALNRSDEAALRSQGIVSACDYIIEGTVVGSSAGAQSFYGSKPAKKFSLGLNLKVIDAATGAVIVTENLASRDILIRSVADDNAAAREAVRQLMDGDPRAKEKTDAGWKLFRRIFSHWSTEMDLGSTFTMEFIGIDLAAAKHLCAELEKNSAVGAVTIRSVDAAGISVVECEARMKAPELAELVEKAIPGFGLDRSENRYLSFRKGASSLPAAPESGPSAADTAAPEGDKALLWAIGGVGGGVIALLAVAIVVLLKRK